MKYPTTNDLMIARQLLIIKSNDQAVQKFIANLNKRPDVAQWTEQNLADALEVYDRAIRTALLYILNRSKTVNCIASQKFAVARLEQMKTLCTTDLKPSN